MNLLTIAEKFEPERGTPEWHTQHVANYQMEGNASNLREVLEDAPLESLNEAMELAGARQEKTRFKAIVAEIKRRLKESGMDASDLRPFEWYSPEQSTARGADAERVRQVHLSALLRGAVARTPDNIAAAGGMEALKQAEAERDQATAGPVLTLVPGKAHTVEGVESGVPLLDSLPSLETGAVEVLPQAKLEDLEQIATTIVRLAEEVQEVERQAHNKTIYSRVGMGLCLLKAQQLHLCETVSRRDDETGQLQAAEGFHAWFRETFIAGKCADEAEEAKQFKAQIRNAQNYMNAARNAGLTSDHTLADVETLRANKTLHHLTAKELYKLKDKETEEELPPADPEISLPEAKMRELFEVLDQILAIKDETPPKVYELIHHRLKETLEKYVGAELIYANGAVPAKPKRVRTRGSRKA